MPRPIFGAAQWWTFRELCDVKRFPAASKVYEPFPTRVAFEADELAQDSDADEDGPVSVRNPEELWPKLEFLVSDGTKTVLMVRRRE